MAFTTPRRPPDIGAPAGRRPYTRTSAAPFRPPDVRDVAASLKRGTSPLSRGPSRPPDAVAAAVAPPATPGATPGQVAPVTVHPSTAGAQADALSQYLAGITDPAERAYVAQQIGPQIAMLRAQQTAHDQQVASEQAAVAGFTQALIDQLKGVVGSSSGPYAQIAATQVAAGKASGDSLSKANPNSANQAILGAINAPDSQAKDLANLDRNVFTGGGAVLTGTGGTLPAYATGAAGLGVLGYAAAQPGIAAAYGQEGMRSILAQAAQDQAQIDASQQDVYGKIPGYRSDYATQQQQAKDAAQQRALSLYNAGFMTQRQVVQQLGLPNWQKYPDIPRGSAAAPQLKGSPRDGFYSWDPSTGKLTQMTAPQVSSATAKPPSTFGSGSTGIYAWQQTPTGWKAVQIVSPRAGRGLAARAARPPQTKTMPNGDLAVWQQTPRGWKLVTIARKGSDPSKPQILGAGGVPMTNAQINTDAATVTRSVASARSQGIRLEKVIDTFENEGIPSQIYMPIIAKKYNIPLNLNPANLGNMGIGRLHNTAVLLGYRPQTSGAPTRAVTSKGAWVPDPANPKKKVWDPTKVVTRTGPAASKQELIGFIETNLPKGEAPTETGATLVSLAKQQLGQPYIWGAESRKEGGFDCSGLVDWSMRQMGYKGPRLTTWTIAQAGLSVSRSDLSPGDLIITNHGKHVVMYAGGGQVIAGSSAAGKVVMQPLSGVSIESIRRLNMASQGGVTVTETPSKGLPSSWAAEVLKGLGAPVTAANIAFMNTWQRREGGATANTAYWNPLNTTLRQPGSSSMNSVGVQAYTNWQTGLRATLNTLRKYRSIVGMLRSGNPNPGFPGAGSDFRRWSGNSYSWIS